MLSNILMWASYFFAFLGLLDLPDDIKQWKAAFKVYGRVPWRLIRQMINITLKTQKSFEFNNLFIVVFIVLIAEAKHFVDGFEYPRVGGIIAILLILQRVLRYIVPPTVIFLASSNPVSTEPLVLLTHRLKPHRVITLIQHIEHVFFMDWDAIFPGNLRTKSILEWRSFVHYLTDVVPITIVDTRVKVPSVVEETERQIKRNLATRTIFLINPDNSSPILEAYGYLSDLHQFRLANEGALSGIAKEVLNIPDSSEMRINWKTLSFHYQETYDAMNKSVPRKFQRPQFVNAMLIKAEYIMDYAYTKFLKEYKGCTMGQIAGRLIEDIPSKKTSGEELAWLKNSREFDEIENIYFSALELSLKTPGYNQAFNTANANNRLGKVARYRREWNKSIEYLNKAISLFEAQCSGMSTLRVISELAEAYYLLGEVYMAHYRQTGDQADRETSKHNFMASMTLDQELEHDYSNTSKIMNAL